MNKTTMRIEYEALGVAQAAVNTAGCTISRVQGNFLGASDAWLQLHDAKQLPANGTAPLRVWPLYSNAPFDWNFQNDAISVANGIFLVVSSTRATLTLSASTMDLFVNGESSFDSRGLTEIGDYVSIVSDMAVWLDAAGPKRLMRLEVTDAADTTDSYVQIHAGDTPATDKIVGSFLLRQGESIDCRFGPLGFSPKRIINGVTYDGCTIAISSEGDTYAAAGLDVFIKATYK